MNKNPEPLDVTVADKPLVIQQPRTLDPAHMMEQMIQKGITLENVAAFTELVKLSEHMEDRHAKREFTAAFVQLQKEIPKVQATRPVVAKDGSVKYTFANFEDIDAQLRPMALKYGFTYSFAEGPSSDSKICKICIVKHEKGHEERNAYTVRIGTGPPNASASQADGAAHQYAKRGALCDAFSIVVEHQDTDARNEGGNITQEQADELEHRLKMVNGDVAAFLKLAGADSFANIMAVKFDLLDSFLVMKEKARR